MSLRALASASLKLGACLNFNRRLLEMAICNEILKFHSTAFHLCSRIRRAKLGLNFILLRAGLQDDYSAILFVVQHIDWID